MPRRKHKKAKRDYSQERRRAPEPTTSIEEDLRQQRIRQRQRQEEEEMKKQAAEASADANAEDQHVEVEIVKPKPQHLILKSAFPVEQLVQCNPSSLSFRCMLEQSPSLHSRYRANLRNLWQSKYLMENLHTNRKATAIFCEKQRRWINHSLPDGMYCSWDMACKHHLHPSTRTLAVSLSEVDNLPTIGTIVQGGWLLMRHPKILGPTRTVSNMHSDPVHVIRIHDKSNSVGTITRGRWENSGAPYKFSWFPQDLSSSHSADLLGPVNDFCFGSDLALFACPRYFGGRALPPMFLSLHDSPDYNLRALNVRNFPESDALRVEMTCEHEKYVAFGHRNGQVSLIDLRQSSTTSSIFQHLETGGSATDMGFLKSARQLLVKRSFGTSQLHDLRLSSSHKTDSSVVFNLSVPGDDIHTTLSANCNGIAVDPVGQQTMISPYINSQQDACLGVWSLGTGVCVGSRILCKNKDRDVIYTEMCQKATPAFASMHKQKMSSFGVWLKCGRFSQQTAKINAKFGTLHHITMPGSWKPQHQSQET